MKTTLQPVFKSERIFKNRKIDEITQQIKELKNIKLHTLHVCEHICKNGKTIIIVLRIGLIEIHELLSKNCIYLCASIRKKKIFEKVKKEIDNIKDF